MRVLTAVGLCAWALFATPDPTMAQSGERAARGVHYGLTGVVAKIQAGMLLIKVPHDLQPRAISPRKADRVGLHHAKIGERVLLLVDSGNVLLDAGMATRKDLFQHRVLSGRMDYSDPYWTEIRLSTSAGSERFEVDTLAASKLSVFSQGAKVTIELDADNVLIDIHPDR